MQLASVGIDLGKATFHLVSAWCGWQRSTPIVISTLDRLRGTSAMRCCDEFSSN